ncbi:deoxyhypusine synthase [Candidatus Woesearchaeota archaeon]|nr:deoxyhypusine synthase [Candidatus Woesearchaeota archaeon]|tara:strand:- start:4203 stop:5108 length:906 start_codon:yes stop_codon:yes gene_type:complete
MEEIKDIKIEKSITVKELTKQLASSGFQAQNLGAAIEILKEARENNAKTFLSFTSNMAASGLRGIFIDLIKNKKVDVIVTSSGSIDEDLIRSKMPYLQGSFEADDIKLGEQGINRMGNIFVPNDRYEFLDEEVKIILERIHARKKDMTASELLKEVGLEWKHEDSFIVQAAKNGVEVFCPGITDGSFGMQLTFFKGKNKDFRIDLLTDFQKIIDVASTNEKKCGIILGGGISKHHTIISTLMGGGFDYAVYVNSNSPYRGSLSSATTEEAKSWGKISSDAKSVTIHGDAAIVFPLLIASLD